MQYLAISNVFGVGFFIVIWTIVCLKKEEKIPSQNESLGISVRKGIITDVSFYQPGRAEVRFLGLVLGLL